MKRSLALACLLVLPNLGCCISAAGQEQPQPPDTAGAAAAGSPQAVQRGPRGDREGRGRPVFGKISAIGNDSMEVTGSEGSKVTLKLTGDTQFRKDRQPAKLADFKVGDPVVVRTDQAGGKGATALLVASGQFGMRNGPGGGPSGTLGKDLIIGEVKAVNPPRLTVLRTDNVTETLELNEETSLRRGRDSITMADIHVGDHVVAHGALENNVFVPKNLNVFAPEQWKRMEEMMAGGGPDSPTAPNRAVSPDRPAAPTSAPNPPSPPEPQN